MGEDLVKAKQFTVHKAWKIKYQNLGTKHKKKPNNGNRFWKHKAIKKTPLTDFTKTAEKELNLKDNALQVHH